MALSADLVQPAVHGLLDGVSLADRMSEWEGQVHKAIRDLGFERVILPESRFPYAVEIMGSYARAARKQFSAWFKQVQGVPPRRIFLQAAPALGRWWDFLGPLDRKRKVSPVLWVRRHGLVEEPLPHWFRPRWELEMCPQAPGSGDLRCYLAYDVNPWWHWDVLRGWRFLNGLSERRLRRELNKGERIMGASERTLNLWDSVVALRPVSYSFTSPGTPDGPDGEFPMPELEAIPFYREQDARVAFETIIQSYLCVSLLEDFADSTFARLGWIRIARENLGLPRPETRGRRRRPKHMVQFVGSMIREHGISVRSLANKLGWRRSKVQGYLKEFDERS